MQTSKLLKEKRMQKGSFVLKTLIVLVLFAPLYSLAQGANMNNPIVMGDYSGGGISYSDTRNNSGYVNDYGQPSEDIFYKFTVQGTTEINISTCSSSIDTYLHL